MGLKTFTIRRIITSFITITLILASLYFIFRLPTFVLGRSPAKLYGLRRIRQNAATSQDISQKEAKKVINRLRTRMGLPPKGASLTTRIRYFLQYMYHMLTFQFGPQTLPPYRPATKLLAERIPLTLLIVAPGYSFSVLLGMALGIEAGKDVGSKKDKGITVFGLSLRSIPSYWLGPLLILFFVGALGLWPSTLGPYLSFTFQDQFWKFMGQLYMYVLPIITMVITGFGGWIYLLRNSLAEVMTEDYIFTAKAKGLDETTVLYRHALRNAILPTWTYLVQGMALIWTGTMYIERIFSIPGVGLLYINAATRPMDWGIEQTFFYFYTISMVLANFVADLSYAVLDPRISYE